MPIATNPDTGETVFLGQDGQWSPAKIATNPETKERLAYDGSSWVALKTPEVSTGADVAKSTGIGIAKGGIGLATMGGDARELLASGADWLSRKLSGPNLTDAAVGNEGPPQQSTVGKFLRGMEGLPLPGPLSIMAMPTSKKLQSAIESKTGEFYQPKTTAGEYAQTFGEFLPAAASGPSGVSRAGARLVPELARRVVTQATIPAATSETAGQVARQIAPELEPYARLVGGVGGGVAASKLEGAAARPGAVKSVPAQEDIKQAAEDAYKEARKLDIAMSPASTRTLATNMRQTLDIRGFRDFTTPKTYRAIEELTAPKTKMEMTAADGAKTKEVVSTLNDVIATRSLLGRIAADPNEKAAASIAIGRIDTYIENLRKSRPALFGEGGSEAARLLGKNGIAPGNYAAAKRSEQITDALEKAQNQAMSTGSGSNIDNATRQQFKQIINNPKKARGYSPAELESMKRVVRGTTAANVARGFGKLAPTGVVSGALSPVIGAMLGSAAGPMGTLVGAGLAPVLGMIGRQIGNVSTGRHAAYADALVRSRSPLAAPTRDPAELAALLANRAPWLRQAIQSGLLIRPQVPAPYGIDQPR